jgi:hypothetical protein
MTRRQFSFGARYYAICEQCLQLCHTSFLGAVRPAGNGFTLPNIVGTNTSFEGNSGSLDRQIEAGEDERFWKVTEAALLQGLRSGTLTFEQARGRYALSIDELRARERDFQRHGLYGLRATRVHFDRDEEP